MAEQLSDDAKKQVNIAYAKFLRDLADTVEHGNYVFFEHNTQNTYPSWPYHGPIAPMDTQLSFRLVVRNG